MSRSQSIRQALQLHIEPFPFSIHHSGLKRSPDSSPSSSSARASVGTAGTTPTTIESDLVSFPVLCMHDFSTNDHDQLPFNKGEILRVVKQEDTGWWAAMRRGGDTIGWIPEAFVKPLSEEKSEKLWGVREEIRVFDHNAERLYDETPTTRNDQLYAESVAPSEPAWEDSFCSTVCISPRLALVYSNIHPRPLTTGALVITLCHREHLCLTLRCGLPPLITNQ